MKTYVITVSEKFPKSHIRAGEYTLFPFQILTKQKKHTIRANYELWEKRFEKINKGEAVLSVRRWAGKPYRSKQVEICLLSNTDKIGIQKLEFDKGQFNAMLVNGKQYFAHTDNNIAMNDGLSLKDFEDWFKGYDLSKPMAIIHLTGFRYSA